MSVPSGILPQLMGKPLDQRRQAPPSGQAGAWCPAAPVERRPQRPLWLFSTIKSDRDVLTHPDREVVGTYQLGVRQPGVVPQRSDDGLECSPIGLSTVGT